MRVSAKFPKVTTPTYDRLIRLLEAEEDNEDAIAKISLNALFKEVYKIIIQQGMNPEPVWSQIMTGYYPLLSEERKKQFWRELNELKQKVDLNAEKLKGLSKEFETLKTNADYCSTCSSDFIFFQEQINQVISHLMKSTTTYAFSSDMLRVLKALKAYILRKNSSGDLGDKSEEQRIIALLNNAKKSIQHKARFVTLFNELDALIECIKNFYADIRDRNKSASQLQTFKNKLYKLSDHGALMRQIKTYLSMLKEQVDDPKRGPVEKGIENILAQMKKDPQPFCMKLAKESNPRYNSQGFWGRVAYRHTRIPARQKNLDRLLLVAGLASIIVGALMLAGSFGTCPLGWGLVAGGVSLIAMGAKAYHSQSKKVTADHIYPSTAALAL